MAPEQRADPLTQFRAQSLDTALRDPSRKQAMVTPMFDVIAPRYDAFTRLFSFGMDRAWKDALLTLMRQHAPRDGSGLDGACGTGDLTFGLCDVMPAGRVLGVDPSAEMLVIARQRAARGPTGAATFALGDLAALPVPSASLDAITVGYGFRNVPDLDAALAECARVLKPGGVIGVLDFYLPRNALWRALFLWYLRISGNVVGWWWHRTPAVYGYIAASIAAFVTHDDFTSHLDRAGFRLLAARQHLLGGIGLHVAARVGSA
jgi:demethylmenaquinone methyltransferase / 2-methoxy-6-polyprenyl-1,4-benzoquinol methylase